VVDQTNPLYLNLTLPTATTEDRVRVAKEVKKVGNASSIAVREARERTNKYLRALKLKHGARVDDIHKAEKEMDVITKKAVEDVSKSAKAAEKAMLES